MDHEVNNGKEFEKRGFGITLKKTSQISAIDMEKAWSLIHDRITRTQMSKSGKTICSGNGINRVVDVIKKYG